MVRRVRPSRVVYLQFPEGLIGKSLLNSPFKRVLKGVRGKSKEKISKIWFFKAFLVRPSVPGGPAGPSVPGGLFAVSLRINRKIAIK